MICQRNLFWAQFLLILCANAHPSSNKNGLLMPSNESIKRAKEILDKTPVIDGHNDFPMNLRSILKNDLTGFNFNSNLSSNPLWANVPTDHTDLPRIREGRLGGQVSVEP